MLAISRHALERYIERVEPVEEIEAHSRIADIVERSKFFGRVGRIRLGNVSLVVEGATVVTVLTKDQRAKRKNCRRTFDIEDELWPA